jgi:uncharacterized membrane protein
MGLIYASTRTKLATLMTAFSPPRVSSLSGRSRWLSWVLWIIVAHFSVTTCLSQIYLFIDYSSPLGLRDLVLFQQPLHNFLTNGTLQTSLSTRDDLSIFAEHAFLFLVFFIPFYSIFKSPLVLMLSQPIAYLFMIFIAYKILKDLCAENIAVIRLVLILMLINPVYTVTLQNFNMYGFHPEFFFPSLFLAAYYFYEKENIPGFLVFYLLSLSIIEYYSLIWIMFSLYELATRNRQATNVFVLLFSITYFALMFLVFVPYFRETSFPWYAGRLSVSMAQGRIDTQYALDFSKTLSINLLLNFAPFVFLPLKNKHTLTVILPLYMAFTLAHFNGYVLPLSAGSWHANALLPIILVGYLKELEQLSQSMKYKVLKIGFAAAIVISVGVQYARPAYSQGAWAIISKYSLLEADYSMIQSIKDKMKNEPILVSTQLGKYFGDFKSVKPLESATVDERIRYILHYSRGKTISDGQREIIRDNFEIAGIYKDITLFERVRRSLNLARTNHNE